MIEDFRRMRDSWRTLGVTASAILAALCTSTARAQDETPPPESGGADAQPVNSIDLMKRAHNWLIEEGPGFAVQVGVAVAIFLLFLLIAKILGRITRRMLDTERAKFSRLLEDFIVSFVVKAVVLIGALVALTQVGVQLGPLLAGLGVAGFIVGFAVQDSLSNFAAGMMILGYRPFDVGDVVEVAGVTGMVANMSLVTTTVQTFDNQRLIVPNSEIWGNVIRNINVEPTRRVDMKFGIGYDDDVDHAETILNEIVSSHELVLEDPEPVIKMHELADSSINFVVRPWVVSADYWTVYWDVTREVKRRFDAEGISIPYPQRDVHLHRVAGDDD